MYTSVESVYLGYIRVYQPLLNKHIFSDVEDRLLDFWYAIGVFHCKISSYCFYCELLVKHLYSEMCKGLDLDKIVEGDSTLPMAVIYETAEFKAYNCKCVMKSTPASCGCCAWSFLELMTHCKTNIKAMMLDDYEDTDDWCETFNRLLYCYTPTVNISQPVNQQSKGINNLHKISRIIKIMWMDDPSSKAFIMDYLHNHLIYNVNDPDEKNEVHGLQDLVLSVRPLMLLCRLCILEHVHWTDVLGIPLPKRLRQYVQIRDISSDHVIHKLLSQ